MKKLSYQEAVKLVQAEMQALGAHQEDQAQVSACVHLDDLQLQVDNWLDAVGKWNPLMDGSEFVLRAIMETK